MKVKIAEASKTQIDWLVTSIEWADQLSDFELMHIEGDFQFCDDWSQGGPIIERERMTLSSNAPDYWHSYYDGGDEHGTFKEHWMRGPTPLVAAMRCFITSRLGDEAEVPDELAEETP